MSFVYQAVVQGGEVVKAADAVGASEQTGYSWQERWNADEFDRLVPRYAGEHPSKLTGEQKVELVELLRKQDHWRPSKRSA